MVLIVFRDLYGLSRQTLNMEKLRSAMDTRRGAH
jgi:hypothetical protein